MKLRYSAELTAVHVNILLIKKKITLISIIVRVGQWQESESKAVHGGADLITGE